MLWGSPMILIRSNEELAARRDGCPLVIHRARLLVAGGCSCAARCHTRPCPRLRLQTCVRYAGPMTDDKETQSSGAPKGGSTPAVSRVISDGTLIELLYSAS